MAERIIDIGPDEFRREGFQALDDTTAAKPGALRVMRNAEVTKRGGLAPRPGTVLLGSNNTSPSRIRGFYNFRRSLDSDELLIKCYDDEIEFLSKDYQSAGWSRLKSGYTVDSEFGFATSLVNTDNEDYLVGGNRYEPYFRWTGAVTALNGVLAGGETAVTVDSTISPDTYESKTATGSSATSLTVSTATWVTSQWVNFYVLITSGALAGKVRKITANDGTSITFDTLGADPGLVTFEVRKLAFPASGTIIYNGTTIAYTAIDTSTTFTVVSAHAAPDDSVVTLVPTEYSGAPRGNRLSNFLTRIVVGNVRSAMARDSGGALQGYSSAGSVFVSKLRNPFDFGYAATRVAGEGDIISMPYGGGDITDVQTQEDQFYAFKERYIESISYSQDSNDLAVRDPLMAGIGSVGKTIRGANDIYFMTPDKVFTSIGRVQLKDIRPQTMNIGEKVSRFLDTCGVDDIGRGAEIDNKLYIPIKSDPDFENNDIILIYNKDTKAFEGIWDIGAFGIERWNGEWYYAESGGANVYEMFNGHADVRGTDRFGIDFEVATHYMNLTASKGYLQAMKGIVIEGYVGGGSSFSTKIWKDFATSPDVQFDFAFTESALLDGSESQAFIGHAPFGIDPMGAAFSEPGADGRRHFSFRTYFPFMYGNYFSFGFSANRADNDFEITRFGLMLSQDPAVNTGKIKNI